MMFLQTLHWKAEVIRLKMISHTGRFLYFFVFFLPFPLTYVKGLVEIADSLSALRTFSVNSSV